MGELKHIIKLNDEQLETLMTTGSVTVDETTVTVDLYGLYLTADEDKYVLYSSTGTVTVATPSAGTDAVNLDYINAVKSELQAQLVGKVDYLGTLTDLSQLHGDHSHVTAGDYYILAIQLLIDGDLGNPGDIVIAKIDTPGSDDWDLIPAEKFNPELYAVPRNAYQPDASLFTINYESGGYMTLPLKGSEGIIVDVAEDNKTIEIHFEDTFLTAINKAARALVTPISAPAEKSIVAVDTNNAQTMMTLTELKNELGSGSGSGGKTYYKHTYYARWHDSTLSVEKTIMWEEITSNAEKKTYMDFTGQDKTDGLGLYYGDHIYNGDMGWIVTRVAFCFQDLGGSPLVSYYDNNGLVNTVQVTVFYVDTIEL